MKTKDQRPENPFLPYFEFRDFRGFKFPGGRHIKVYHFNADVVLPDGRRSATLIHNPNFVEYWLTGVDGRKYCFWVPVGQMRFAALKFRNNRKPVVFSRFFKQLVDYYYDNGYKSRQYGTPYILFVQKDGLDREIEMPRFG